jgi:membrane associated rhomboid family serine protease
MSSSPSPPRPEPSPLGRGPGRARLGTTGLVLANLAVGLLMSWAGASVFVPDDAAILVSFGAVDPPRIWSGEIWRLFTACFVHVGAIHLGLNLWVLWQVGRAYERLVGTARVVLVYFVSGIFGFAASTALSPGLTAGASGAIFGLTGALLSVAVLTRQERLGRFLMSALLPFVLATFALGVVAADFVNNIAHVGGLAMGFVLGFGLVAGERSFLHEDDEEADVDAWSGTIRPWEQPLGVAALVVAVGLFALTSLYGLKPHWSPRFHAVMGLRDAHEASTNRIEADRAQAKARAREHLQAATSLAPQDATTDMLAARLAALDGDLETARKRAAKAYAGWLALTHDRSRALDRGLAELALVVPDTEMPFADGFAVSALCDAALDDEGRKAASPDLKNSCAWLWLRANEPAVRNPTRGLLLAREAWDESRRERADIAHTYAEALAQTGSAEEGLAVLEFLSVTGRVQPLSERFLVEERVRLGRRAEEQRRGSPRAEPAVPAVPAVPDPHTEAKPQPPSPSDDGAPDGKLRGPGQPL